MEKRSPNLQLPGALIIMLLGLVIFLRPLLGRGFGRAPGDLGDGRFIHYLLEHSWQWISQNPNHPLWDPPYYFPVRGVGAYSDLMAGAGPMYWPWRLLGMGPGDAYNAWLITIAVLNVLAGFLVFWRCLRFSPLAAAMGATFLSVAAPLQNQSNHPQMLPQFYLLGMFAGLVMLARSGQEPTSPGRRNVGAALVAAGFVLQMYTAFYYAWFALLAGGIALSWALVLRRTRPQVITSLRLNARPLAVSGTTAVIALVPWAFHYLDAASLNPPITYAQMSGWIPRWESWLYPGPNSPVYEWMLGWSQFAAIPQDTNHEHRLGVGLVTIALIGLGYASHWRHRWVQVSALVGISLVLMTTIVPGGITAWRLLFEILPGASAVRTLTRVALIVLIPMAIGLALLVDRIRDRRLLPVVPLIVAVVLVEQVVNYPTYDIDAGVARSEAISVEISSECRSFLYSPSVAPDQASSLPTYVVQLDAMWAGILADIPTVNAYGHIVPEDWPFAEPVIATPADQDRLADAIDEWEALHPDAAPLCLVTLDLAP